MEPIKLSFIFTLFIFNGLFEKVQLSNTIVPERKNIYVLYSDKNCKDCFKDIFNYCIQNEDTSKLNMNVIFPYNESKFNNKLRVHSFKKEINPATNINFYFSENIFDSLKVNITPCVLLIDKNDTTFINYNQLFKNKQFNPNMIFKAKK